MISSYFFSVVIALVLIQLLGVTMTEAAKSENVGKGFLFSDLPNPTVDQIGCGNTYGFAASTVCDPNGHLNELGFKIVVESLNSFKKKFNINIYQVVIDEMEFTNDVGATLNSVADAAKVYSKQIFDHWNLTENDILVLIALKNEATDLLMGETIVKRFSESNIQRLVRVMFPFLGANFDISSAFAKNIDATSRLLLKNERPIVQSSQNSEKNWLDMLLENRKLDSLEPQYVVLISFLLSFSLIYLLSIVGKNFPPKTPRANSSPDKKEKAKGGDSKKRD